MIVLLLKRRPGRPQSFQRHRINMFLKKGTGKKCKKRKDKESKDKKRKERKGKYRKRNEQEGKVKKVKENE